MTIDEQIEFLKKERLILSVKDLKKKPTLSVENLKFWDILKVK